MHVFAASNRLAHNPHPGVARSDGLDASGYMEPDDANDPFSSAHWCGIVHDPAPISSLSSLGFLQSPRIKRPWIHTKSHFLYYAAQSTTLAPTRA
jgi:hypothetical protein